MHTPLELGYYGGSGCRTQYEIFDFHAISLDLCQNLDFTPRVELFSNSSTSDPLVARLNKVNTASQGLIGLNGGLNMAEYLAGLRT